MSRDTDPPLLTDLMRFKPEGWSANAWAVAAGVSRTVWSDMRRHANPSRRTLEKLLGAAGSSLAEFEALRVGASVGAAASEEGAALSDRLHAWRGAPLAPIPVIHAEATGSEGLAVIRFDQHRRLGSVERPASLAGEVAAFAMPIVDGSMTPRFRVGRRVIVVPGRPVAPGDDVLAIISEGRGAIAELVERRDDGVILRQHRRPGIVEVAAVAVHLIAGEAL